MISLTFVNHRLGFLSGSSSDAGNSLLPVQMSISSNLTHRVFFQNLYTTTNKTNTGNRI